MTSVSPPPSKLSLPERYEALEVVGRGGQGHVVFAWDRRHRRPVALKVRSLDGVSEERVLSEARILLEIRPHPNLPVVRDDLSVDGHHVLVMDWIEGRSLDRVVVERGPLAIDEVVSLLAPVAAALDHLHAHDPPVVHGDVKPANVVVDASGGVVLVDFGVAAPTGTAAVTYGTTGYLAPETAAGRPPTPAADVFSLAATAFALLSGSPPRPGVTLPWASMPPGRAKVIEAALRRGLAFDPSRRPKTAGEFVALLGGKGQAPTNLPSGLTALIGRDEEVADTTLLLGKSRLLTLSGPGGVGKTRLALALATAVLDDYPDGTFWVGLEPLAHPGLIASQIAQALGVRPEPGTPIEEPLTAWLLARRLLLVLDNCEHLIEAVATLVDMLLTQAPHLRVLATSRETLRLPGETVYRVPSLGEDDAVRLFVARAEAAKPGFTLTAQVEPAVAEICRRLDGIPLGIELAAARVPSLAPADLARRLDDRFRLLTTGTRTAPRRHQTLRAAIDWSFEALDDPERQVFRQLGVFAGGFTLDAAEWLCAGTGIDRRDVAGVVSCLADKSMVVAEVRANGTRYRLLETLRSYALERLTDDGGVEPARHRHLNWCVKMAEDARPSLYGPNQLEVLRELADEHANIRTALQWSLDAGSPELGLRIARALRRFWGREGRSSEALEWLSMLLSAAPEASPRLRAEALCELAGIAFVHGEPQVIERAGGEALALYRSLDDKIGIAEALLCGSPRLGDVGDWARVRVRAEEALTLWNEAVAEDSSALDVPWHRAIGAMAQVMLGYAALNAGDMATARAWNKAALAAARESGDVSAVAQRLFHLAQVAIASERHDEARALIEEGLALPEALGPDRNSALALNMLGYLSRQEGDLEQARRAHRRALQVAVRAGNRYAAGVAAGNLALALVEGGEWQQAVRLISSAQKLDDKPNKPLIWFVRAKLDRARDEARKSLTKEAFERAWSEGAALSLEMAAHESTPRGPM